MKRAVSERMMSHRAELSNKALAKYLPVFSVLALGGLFAIAFLPMLWREAGDTPLNMTVTVAYFVGAGVATVVLAMSLFFPKAVLKHVSLLTVTLIAVMFFTLSSAFYYQPSKTWSVGVATMVLVASGTVLYSQKWVLLSVLLGWSAFLVPSLMLWNEARNNEVIIFWRTYSMMLLFASLCAFFIHRYVHTYIGSLSGLTERAVISAESDKLTGLLNRTGLENVYAIISGRTSDFSSSHAQVVEKFQNSHTIGMIFLDMNGLKKINDTYGHLEGDKAICLIAEALKASTRWGEDICARWGGDEFIVLSAGGSLSEKILQQRMDYWLAENSNRVVPFPVSVAVGEAVLITTEASFDYVLNLADEHMYKKKPQRS